jgi:hypothetical protein
MTAGSRNPSSAAGGETQAPWKSYGELSGRRKFSAIQTEALTGFEFGERADSGGPLVRERKNRLDGYPRECYANAAWAAASSEVFRCLPVEFHRDISYVTQMAGADTCRAGRRLSR